VHLPRANNSLKFSKTREGKYGQEEIAAIQNLKTVDIQLNAKKATEVLIRVKPLILASIFSNFFLQTLSYVTNTFLQQTSAFKITETKK
jgi:hypothetical protein